MSPEVSRREFLALGSVALVSGRKEDVDDAPAWWEACGTSPEFRRIAEAETAEGVVISPSGLGSFHLGFVDDDFPLSTPITLPRAQARRELQIVGTAHYEVSVIDACSGDLSVVVTFPEPSKVTIYADESKHGGVLIVAMRRRGG